MRSPRADYLRWKCIFPDIKKREKFRHHSMTAGACIGMISGQGFPGYLAALRLLAKL